jgi:signal peptidase II
MRNKVFMSKQFKLSTAIVIILGVLLFDQSLKIWIKQTFYAYEQRNLLGTWFRLYYVENPGMAFGATFGSGIWAKLGLSVFRLIAVTFGLYYLVKIIRDSQKKLGYVIAISLVLAGAIGNIIDSAFYDFIFPFNTDLDFNFVMDGNKIVVENGVIKLRQTGFLLGNVVDMFQFNVTYPKWVPYMAGKDVFSAIWNVADASIFCGIVIILIGQRAFFPTKKKEISEPEDTPDTLENKSLLEV